MTSRRTGTGANSTRRRAWPAVMLVMLFAGPGALAQDVAEATAPRTYDAVELDRLVGPVALYVDDLVAIVLAASAYPLQVVEAERFLEARESDPSLEPDESWDDAVIALLNYPEVLRMMSADLSWTADLGEAYVYQPSEVLDAVQRFRERARALGSFDSDGRQVVSEVDGAITVAPADPQVIYVPDYDPERVVGYGAPSSLSYYSYGYPSYHYPYPIGYSFGSRYFWGVTTAFVIGWNTHRVHAYPRGCDDHPYRWYSYHQPYYTRHDTRPNWNSDRGDYVWVPGDRFRPRQERNRDHSRDRDWDRDDTRHVLAAGNRGAAQTPPATSALANSATTFRRQPQANRHAMAAQRVADQLRPRAGAEPAARPAAEARPAPAPNVSRMVRAARVPTPGTAPRPAARPAAAPPPPPPPVQRSAPQGPRGDSAVASGSRRLVER